MIENISTYWKKYPDSLFQKFFALLQRNLLFIQILPPTSISRVWELSPCPIQGYEDCNLHSNNTGWLCGAISLSVDQGSLIIGQKSQLFCLWVTTCSLRRTSVQLEVQVECSMFGISLQWVSRNWWVSEMGLKERNNGQSCNLTSPMTLSSSQISHLV